MSGDLIKKVSNSGLVDKWLLQNVYDDADVRSFFVETVAGQVEMCLEESDYSNVVSEISNFLTDYDLEIKNSSKVDSIVEKLVQEYLQEKKSKKGENQKASAKNKKKEKKQKEQRR